MSLLAMLLTYDSIAGEKERQTLHLIMANAVPRTTVILAKISTSTVLLSIVFLLGVLVGTIVLAMTGFRDLGNRGFMIRFSVAIAVSLLYIGIFAVLGVLVSALNKSAISAMISLMTCWIFLFVLFPRASAILSKIAKPVRSQEVIEMEKEQFRSQVQSEQAEHIRRLREQTPGVQGLSWQEYFTKLREGDPLAKAYEAKQGEIREMYRIKCESELLRLDDFYGEQRKKQAVFSRNTSRLSMIGCYMNLFAEISDTGFLEYEHCLRLRSRFRETLNSQICSKLDTLVFGNVGFMGNAKVDKNAPLQRLGFPPVRFREVLSMTWPDIVALLLHGIIYFAAAYVSFLRYDVR